MLFVFISCFSFSIQPETDREFVEYILTSNTKPQKQELHISFDEEKLYNEMLQEWSKIQNLTGKQQKEIAQEERNNLKAFVQKYEYSYIS